MLHQCYQLANLAIVAGSFVSHVGGHNILEPVLAGVPVFFGPHLHNQPDFKELVLTSQAGQELTIDQVPQAVTEFFQDTTLQHSYRQACTALTASVRGAVDRTDERIFSSRNRNLFTKKL
jgi:3-deoxy-D-manno-octulosonic-acid transferase